MAGFFVFARVVLSLSNFKIFVTSLSARMLRLSTYRTLQRQAVIWLIALGFALTSSLAFGQSTVHEANIDPRLIEIVETVKSRILANPEENVRQENSISKDEVYLDLIDQMNKAFYSRNSEEISLAVRKFQDAHPSHRGLGLDRVSELYGVYANLLSRGVSPSEIQTSLTDFTNTGSWFERYSAYSLSSYEHARAQERQAALQKAQLALSLIPTKPDPQNESYVLYAKSRAISTIAQLHNLQGNSELAISASLDYLQATSNNPDPQYDVDLINNLIFSYSLARNHKVPLYLSEQLLEIEKTQSSNVAGLSEMRIAGVMNRIGRYQEALEYSEKSILKAKNPIIKKNAPVNKAIALAGAGRLAEARKAAEDAGIDLTREHVLNSEKQGGVIYLAFLLERSEDPEYATQLFNRQMDITAQKFLANNSRDTTAMVAELENSRERQQEREAAAAREAALQAMTIDRQKKLNRSLIMVAILLAGIAIGALLILKSREKLLSKLRVKTVEAASAEKLKTDFLGMISHELRTPLNGIIGISDFLANYHEDPDIRQKTGIVLRSGNELLSVVEALTDMARLDAGQLALAPHDAALSVSLPKVSEGWKDKAEEKGLVFTQFVDPSIGVHRIDEARVLQCLNILLANAVSFTNAGRVHLHITGDVDDQNNVVGLTAIVADTGRGMSELVQSRLFTPFMQADTSRKRNHMGTGLSLAIAYALAEMMGGHLGVISREGRGSEFKLVIPLPPAEGTLAPVSTDHEIEVPAFETETSDLVENEDPLEELNITETPVLDGSDAPTRELVDLMQPPTGFSALHAHEEKLPLNVTSDRLRILVVDDVDSNRDVLRMILESQGHDCRGAADGFAALAMLERQPFDLVVMDIHMAPLDGVEALRRLRAAESRIANIPVIALTADNAASTNAACMEAGADIFLTKPVQKDELLRAVDYLHQAQGARILSG